MQVFAFFAPLTLALKEIVADVGSVVELRPHVVRVVRVAGCNGLIAIDGCYCVRRLYSELV